MSSSASARRLVVTFVAVVLLLTSVSATVAHASTAPADAPVASVDERVDPPQLASPAVSPTVGEVGQPVAGTVDTSDLNSASESFDTPLRATSQSVVSGGHVAVDTLDSGVELVDITSADQRLSTLTLQIDRALGDGPLGPSGLLALAGYSRAEDADPLEHDVRSRLYETITASPGIYPAALVESVDVHRSTVRYHLRVLTDEGLVTECDVDGKQRYVAADATAAEEALAVIDEGTSAASIVDHLATDGPATVSTLAERLDRSVSTVSYHLDRLEDAAIVDRVREGQAVKPRLSDDVRPLVTQTMDASADSFAAAADD